MLYPLVSLLASLQVGGKLGDSGGVLLCGAVHLQLQVRRFF
jgi:hypothetical protein